MRGGIASTTGCERSATSGTKEQRRHPLPTIKEKIESSSGGLTIYGNPVPGTNSDRVQNSRKIHYHEVRISRRGPIFIVAPNGRTLARDKIRQEEEGPA